MDLFGICLDQITDEKFEMFRGFWHRRTRDSKNFNYVKIATPLSSSDYRALLEEFLECPYNDKVSVNDRGTWKKYYTRKMRERDISEIAEIAKRDNIKRGHLEFYFKTYHLANTKIKFVERDGLIIGYEMMFPKLHSELFSWLRKPELLMDESYGLWVPRTA